MATALDLLKALGMAVPGTEETVSPDVMENEPEIGLDTPHTTNEIEGNARLKQLLGLGPSPLIQEQQKEQDVRDAAVNAARIQNNPDVSAEADKSQFEKILLAHAQPGGLETENAKIAAEAEAQRQQNDQTQQLMQQYVGGGGGTGGAAPASTPYGPVGMKPAINAKNQVSFTPIMPTAQTQTQAHAATIGLDQLDKTNTMIDDLNTRGLIGPVEGRKNSALTTMGLDQYLMHPADAQAFSDFKNQLSLTKSNMGYVHGGTRGGSSQALLNRFDQLINPNMSAAGMKGALAAYKSWLSEYASVPENDVAGQEAVSNKYLAILGGQ